MDIFNSGSNFSSLRDLQHQRGWKRGAPDPERASAPCRGSVESVNNNTQINPRPLAPSGGFVVTEVRGGHLTPPPPPPPPPPCVTGAGANRHYLMFH
ncbi:hypothetical protein JYU34_002618 [Plutella xylostella]|uniref:Uncharacterized protein n=1 Tax=Plutella xylostella TaxID=51655 RepID=A0ABQ7R2P8_PLUXY|nr:hypothetical protein JYU34_002618 [Plutella xylostella]